MITITDLLVQSLEKVWVTFTHNWIFLLVSVLISVGLKLYIDPKKVSNFIMRYRRIGIIGATAAAVTTPLCSCGTTAVILGMIASTIPWSPIVAFMVASPLTSPEEMVYSAGLFGWRFAITFFVSSILLGLLGGILADLAESRGWLVNQARFPIQENSSSSAALPEKHIQAVEAICDCDRTPNVLQTSACACGSFTTEIPKVVEAAPQRTQTESRSQTPVSVRRAVEEIYRTGKQLLLMFLGFAFIGYLLNGLIPQSWVSAIFGEGNIYSVPLAATLGLPFYINTEGSLPLVRALIDGGMSQGAALAFLITGAGTSIGAVAGALTIARWRVIGLVVGTLWIGAVVLGYAYNFLLPLL